MLTTIVILAKIVCIKLFVSCFSHVLDQFLSPFNIQSFPQREQLQQQYCGKGQPEPFKCLFKDNSVKNVVPDPDVPHGCNSNSSEYDSY